MRNNTLRKVTDEAQKTLIKIKDEAMEKFDDIIKGVKGK